MPPRHAAFSDLALCRAGGKRPRPTLSCEFVSTGPVKATPCSLEEEPGMRLRFEFFTCFTTQAAWPGPHASRTSVGPCLKQHPPRECPKSLNSSWVKTQKKHNARHCTDIPSGLDEKHVEAQALQQNVRSAQHNAFLQNLRPWHRHTTCDKLLSRMRNGNLKKNCPQVLPLRSLHWSIDDHLWRTEFHDVLTNVLRQLLMRNQIRHLNVLFPNQRQQSVRQTALNQVEWGLPHLVHTSFRKFAHRASKLTTSTVSFKFRSTGTATESATNCSATCGKGASNKMSTTPLRNSHMQDHTYYIKTVFQNPRHSHSNKTCDKLLCNWRNGDFHDLWTHPIRNQTHRLGDVSQFLRHWHCNKTCENLFCNFWNMDSHDLFTTSLYCSCRTKLATSTFPFKLRGPGTPTICSATHRCTRSCRRQTRHFNDPSQNLHHFHDLMPR